MKPSKKQSTPQAIPSQLREAQRWMLWKSIPDPNRPDKPRKVPYYVDGGTRGATDTPADAARLATYAVACKALAAGGYTGLGFALGGGWQGLDCDGCRDPATGAIEAWALPFLEYKTYAEVSPSGKGFHLLGYDPEGVLATLSSNTSGIEFYAKGRYFTFTGQRLNGLPKKLLSLAPVYDLAKKQWETGAKAARERAVQSDGGREPLTWLGAKAKLQTLLGNYDLDSREDWLKLGMVIAKESGKSADGYAFWVRWSQGGVKFKPEGQLAAWNSFKRNEGGVGIGTLVMEQKSQGKPVITRPSDQPSVPGTTFGGVNAEDHPELEWFIPEVLTAGAHALIGPPKVGKGYLILQMCEVLECGGHFVGSTVTGGVNVAYFAAEDNNARIKRRLMRTRGRAKNVALYTLEAIETLARDHADKTPHGFIEYFCEQYPQIKVIIIDSAETFRAIWNGEKLDADGRASVTQADYQAARVYDSVGLRLGRCIMLINHTAKRKTHSNSDYHERTNKSGAYFAGLTASMVMDWPDGADTSDPKEKRRVLALRSREGDRSPVWLMEFNDKSQFEFMGEYFENRQTDLMREIMDALVLLQGDSGEPVNAQAIATHIGSKKTTVTTTIERSMKSDRARGEVDGVQYVISAKRGSKGGYIATRV